MIRYRFMILFVVMLLSLFSWKIFMEAPDKVIDTSWHFVHCTSNSSTDCGRLE
jgi:hypothetical protein